MDKTLPAGPLEGQMLPDLTLFKHLQESCTETEVNSVSTLPLQQRLSQLQQSQTGTIINPPDRLLYN